ADFSDCIVEDENGEPKLCPKRLKKKGKLHLVDRIVRTKYGNNIVPHSKLQALKMLAQINGMLKDVQDTNLTVQTDRDRAIAEVDAAFQAAKLDFERRKAEQAALPAPGSTDPV